MTTGDRSRRLATTCLALMLAVVLAACGSSSPSPSASTLPGPAASATATAPSATPAPSEAPTPSPTPKADVARPFLAILMSRTFTATAKISGELTVGSTTFPVTGTYDVRASDNRQSMTIGLPSPQTTESVTAGGVTYVKRAGLWFERAAPAAGSAPSTDLASSLRSLLDLVDTGTVTKAGRTLHHLAPSGTASIPLSAIGASDPTGDGAVTIDFYVEDDGTPVVMTIAATWTQPSGKTAQRASMTLDYTFSNVGGQVVIAAPLQVWTTFKSKRFGYSMSYPVDWEAGQSPTKTKPDSFVSAEGSGVFILRVARQGFSLNTITSAFIKEVKRAAKASVTSNKAATIDGFKARRLEFTGVFDGSREYDSEIIVVRGKYVYFFEYSSLEKLTKSDRDLFDSFIKSVRLPSKAAATSATSQVS